MTQNESHNQSIAVVLSSKSTANQQAFKSLNQTFGFFELQAAQLIQNLQESKNTADDISLEINKLSAYELNLTVASNMIVLILHTNIATFDDQYANNKSAYVSKDINRRYLGQINMYNFMADSVRYNRVNDPGYLVARILINREDRFFVEGDQKLSFLYKDISVAPICEEDISALILCR